MGIAQAFAVTKDYEEARIRWYAWALRKHSSRVTPEFIVEALSDPAWPGDSRDAR